MSAATPAAAVLWRDTQAGRNEAWVKQKVDQRYSFEDAIYSIGIKRAARVMREMEEHNGQHN